jgi:aminoglycoside phosphotransferase (APT) family kinase protein
MKSKSPAPADAEPAVGIPAHLVDWIETVTDGTVVTAERRPGGGRKEAWFIDVDSPDGVPRELFLRLDRSDAVAAGDPWTLHRESIVYRALGDSAVPIPRVVAVHDVEQAMLTERVQGDTWFSRIADTDESERVARDFMVALAALHRIDPHTLELPGFRTGAPPGELVQCELDEWRAVLERRGGDVDPALEITLRWLEDNVPDWTGPAVLVQGDTGPGNFMYARGRVVAVVDWEFAHLGDPMDDIAWLTLRAAQEGFPDLPARLREYEAMSGHAVDLGRIRYYRVMAEAKLQVMVHRPGGMAERFAHGEGGGGDIGNALIYGMLHRRLWFEAMADVMGFELPAVTALDMTQEGGHEWLYDVVLDQLRSVVVPRVDDPLARARVKSVARVLKYLAAIDHYGPSSERRELAEAAAVLNTDYPSSIEARAALTRALHAAEIDDVTYLQCAWRRIARDNELMRAASGALADRHWPAVG